MWEEKRAREPGTHCSCMCQVPLVTCITEGTEHAFFSTHTREAGNEANDHSERVNISVRNAADLLLYV